MKHGQKIVRRRGSIMVYSLYMMFLMFVIISLAVDYGHVQIVKTEEQRCADATARGVLECLLARYKAAGFASPTAMAQASNGSNSWPTYLGNLIAAQNPVDPLSGYSPTVTVTPGSWVANAWVNDGGAAGPLAIKVVVSRAKANTNSVPLAFPFPSGKGVITKTCDVWASSIAMLPNPVILLSGGSVSSTGDIWLAGMPAGSTASDDDTAPSQSPSPLSVIPGSTLTFANVTGKVKHMPDANVATDGDGPNGGSYYWHLKDSLNSGYATATEGQGFQNGIGDVSAPIDSMIGVFLNSAQPDSAANSSIANPTSRVYTTDMADTNAMISDIQLQQPFYIGDGTNSTGAVQNFIVPANTTRFYLGIMDGYEWNNNVGSFTVGTLTEQPPIQIVQ